MKTVFVEATQGMVLWSKFQVSQYDATNLVHESVVSPGRPLLMRAGISPYTLSVMDLETREGVLVYPFRNDQGWLRSCSARMSPLIGAFVEWLSKTAQEAGQGTFDVGDLPAQVELTSGRSVAQEGSLPELLKRCMRSDDKEMRSLARKVWAAECGAEAPIANVPITLEDLDRWMSWKQAR